MSSAQGRNDLEGEAPRGATASTLRRRRKSLRHHFCDAVEAAVKAEPQAFKATRPRTMMGLMVRELVCAAASARSDAIKTVVAFLDEAEVRRTAAHMKAADNSQGNFEPEFPPEPKWDWSEDGAWDSSEREPEIPDQENKSAQPSDAERAEMGAKLRAALRSAAKADWLEEQREAQLAAERDAAIAAPATPVSGNIAAPATPDPGAGTMRIAGRLVQG